MALCGSGLCGTEALCWRCWGGNCGRYGTSFCAGMMGDTLDSVTHTSHTHIWPRVSVPQARKTYLERKINSLQLNLRELIGGAVAASN